MGGSQKPKKPTALFSQQAQTLWGGSGLAPRILPGPSRLWVMEEPALASSGQGYIKISYIAQQTSESSASSDRLGLNMHEKLPRND